VPCELPIATEQLFENWHLDSDGAGDTTAAPACRKAIIRWEGSKSGLGTKSNAGTRRV